MSRSLKSQPVSKSKECIARTVKTPVLSKEICDLPIVRRSKKHTRLNSVNIIDFAAGRREIDRTVLLPYLGCTKRYEPFQSYNAHVFAKTSKSWETVGKSIKPKNIKQFRSQTFNNESSINNTSSQLNFLDYQDFLRNEKLAYPLGEYELPNTGFSLSKEAVRSFYLIKPPISGAKTIYGRKNTFENGNNVSQQNYNSGIPTALYQNKNELDKNITRFKGQVFAPPPKLNLKATRNVSILHRPKTRDKSTSTTFLDVCNNGQDLDKSIQGLLMPYIVNGRDFPSEIVLKLVSKAEALKNAAERNKDLDNRSNYSSEINLLAPKLNSTETKHKKKKGKSFWNCFSKKTDDATADDISNTDVYYPSIVEVHNKNNKHLDQPNSEVCNSVSSFQNVNKKNK